MQDRTGRTIKVGMKVAFGIRLKNKAGIRTGVVEGFSSNVLLGDQARVRDEGDKVAFKTGDKLVIYDT